MELPDVVTFLIAMGEPEMAEAVSNQHNRLEAFSSGLDRDCFDTVSAALTAERALSDRLAEALRTALESLAAWEVESATSTGPKSIKQAISLAEPGSDIGDISAAIKEYEASRTLKREEG